MSELADQPYHLSLSVAFFSIPKRLAPVSFVWAESGLGFSLGYMGQVIRLSGEAVTEVGYTCSLRVYDLHSWSWSYAYKTDLETLGIRNCIENPTPEP